MTAIYRIFIKKFLNFLPSILLIYFCVSEISTQFKTLSYLSFNFPFIIIYYWVLKSPKNLPYSLIFISGILNDVIAGSPIGLTALSFLIIAGVAAYVRNITVKISLIVDWLTFLPAILISNAVYIIVSLIITSTELNYFSILFETSITFLIYPIIGFFFSIIKNFATEIGND